MLKTLASWALWAAVLQLVGTALVVWGVKVVSNTDSEYSDGRKVHRFAGIERERAWAVTLGLWLLFIGLACQVVAAIYP